MTEAVEPSLGWQESAVEAGAVLRVMNGALGGCEYRLGAGATLFVVQPESALLMGDAAPDLPENAIVIPVEGAACNFEIVLDDAISESFVLRRLAEDGIEESACRYQSVCDTGGLKFALRRISDAWDASLFGVRPDEGGGIARPNRWWWGVMAVTIVLMLGCGVAAVAWLWDGFRAVPVRDVESLIGGAPFDYTVLPARERRIVYVFAGTQRDAMRARQALVRGGRASGVEVVTTGDEELRVRRRLLESMPEAAVHRVRLDNPAEPVLVVSDERTSRDAAVVAKLLARLRDSMPYAKSIGIERLSDSLIEQRAIAGIEAVGATYRRGTHGNGVVLRIGGDLDDAGVSKLRLFIESFEKGFGAHYISFVMDERPEWMRGKSFKYGGVEYVKTGKEHWYFDGDLF